MQTQRQLTEYSQKRLEATKPKPPIIPQKNDLDFFNLMELNTGEGVRALRRYLPPLNHDDNVIQMPSLYYPQISQILDAYEHFAKGGAFYTPNSFKSWTAQKTAICGVKSCFMDIDFLDDEIIPADTRMQLIRMILNDAKLPEPTAWIDSGTGMHLYYILDETVPINSPIMIRLFERIHEEFITRFNQSIGAITSISLKADFKRKNINSQMRLPCTWNGRNKCTVHQINSSHTYDIDYLMDYMPDKKEKAHRSQISASKDKSNIRKIVTPNTLNVSRVHDLLLLAELRNYDMRGQRNEWLHILASQYVHHASEEWQAEIYKANNMLVEPLADKEIETIIKSAERHEYLYKNKTIVNKLSITKDEMQHMQIIKPMTAREKREQERADKRAKKKARNKEIKRLYAEGMNKSQIAKTLKVSRPTINKILKGEEL